MQSWVWTHPFANCNIVAYIANISLNSKDVSLANTVYISIHSGLHLPHIARSNFPFDHLNSSQTRISRAEISFEIMSRVTSFEAVSTLGSEIVAISDGNRRTGALSRIVRHALQVLCQKSCKTRRLCLKWPFGLRCLLWRLRPLSGA